VLYDDESGVIGMPTLTSIKITFVTQSIVWGLIPQTGLTAGNSAVVHVFVKNRSIDTSRPEGGSDFVSNVVAWKQSEADWDADKLAGATVILERNPFLGAGFELITMERGAHAQMPQTSAKLDLQLRGQQPVRSDEIELPVVDIHLFVASELQWQFSYTLDFGFDEGDLGEQHFTYSPQQEGIGSILLADDSPNYSGICSELAAQPTKPKQSSPPVTLVGVILDFGTHSDDKAASTKLNVHIANRLSATQSQDIAVALDLLPGQHFLAHSATVSGTNTVEFGEGFVPLSTQPVHLQDIVLPMVYITIAPTGADRWVFDYRVTYIFDNGQTFTSSTNGVCLNLTSSKHAGAYTGPAFPTYAPMPPRSAVWQPTILPPKPKQIPLGLLRSKINTLVNTRPDPIFWLRLHCTDDYGVNVGTQSYIELRTISADPPPPGTLSTPDYTEPVRWSRKPTSLGFLAHNAVFANVSSKLTIGIEQPVTKALPVTVRIVFDTTDQGDGAPIIGKNGWEVHEFWVELHLSLDWDPERKKLDVMRWASDLPNVTKDSDGARYYKGELIVKVYIRTDDSTDFGGLFQGAMRDAIWDMLTTPAVITEHSMADQINDYVNAWLLGGMVRGDYPCVVTDAHVDSHADTFSVTYSGPRYDPPVPADWPSGVDLTPGALSNIEHIIVLTKENRSFDHMLGYLSLPPELGGQGRMEVDGLKGGEFNNLNGVRCSTLRLARFDTIFSPNPPQDPQRTLRQVNGGRMDGFVETYADQDGALVAPSIMSYHTADTVPQYDALSRDFAVCHRWFASHPGSTFPNRYYELSGQPKLTPYFIWYTDNAEQLRDLDFSSRILPELALTIFDHLTDAGVSWTYFEHDYCFLRMFADHTFDDAPKIVSFEDPANGFVALCRRGELPSVSFIDPPYIDLPPGAACDEPPSDVKNGQEFARRVVEAVVASPAWDKTLLIITYDEHGGFYDHVPPPRSAQVEEHLPDICGLRVPTFIVSPWVNAGTVIGHDGPKPPVHVGPPTPAPAAPHDPAPAEHAASHETASPGVEPTFFGPVAPLHFDHTSILKTIARRFLGSYEDPTTQKPPYLGARYAAAKDLGPSLAVTPRRGPFRPFIPYTLVYEASQLTLEVQTSAPGAACFQTAAHPWGDPPNSLAQSQGFRLEDAGDGWWYLRTHDSTLYLTANAAMQVVQDHRYASDGSDGNPLAQRWKLTPGITPAKTGLTITNALYPTKALQPAGGSTAVNAPVVLGDPEVGTAAHVPNAWQVTSPLFGAAPIVSVSPPTPAPLT
jgi:hypothetical protein